MGGGMSGVVAEAFAAKGGGVAVSDAGRKSAEGAEEGVGEESQGWEDHGPESGAVRTRLGKSRAPEKVFDRASTLCVERRIEE